MDAGAEGSGRGASPLMVGHLSLLLAVSCWSSSLVVNKQVLLWVTPGVVFATQLSVAALVLWGLVLVRGGGWRLPRTQVLPVMAMGLLAPGSVNLLNVLGTARTSAVSVVVIFGLMPLMMPILGRIVLGEALRLSALAGAAVAVSGTVAIVLHRQDGAGDPVGDLLILGAVILSCSNQLLGRRMNQVIGRPLVVATYQVSAAALFSLAALPLLGVPAAPFGPEPAGAFALVLYNAVFGTVLVFVFYNTGLRHIPVGQVGVYMTLVPALGVVLATVLLGEPFGRWEAAGLVLVVAGIALPTLVGAWTRS